VHECINHTPLSYISQFYQYFYSHNLYSFVGTSTYDAVVVLGVLIALLSLFVILLNIRDLKLQYVFFKVLLHLVERTREETIEH